GGDSRGAAVWNRPGDGRRGRPGVPPVAARVELSQLLVNEDQEVRQEMQRTLALTILVVVMAVLAPVAAAQQDGLVVVSPESHVPFFEYIAEQFEERYGVPLIIVRQAHALTPGDNGTAAPRG